MLEKNIAFENIDAIFENAKAKGVDMSQWGPVDFGFSRGEPGLAQSPEIKPFEEAFIAKSLERIGDHAVNISQSVIYTVKGKDVRHSSIKEIKKELS